MEFQLTGRRALVTGAGSGIGRAIAESLGRLGASVAVHYANSEEGAKSVAKEIADGGGKAIALQADLTSSVAANQLVADTVAELGGLDIVVCNSGHLVDRVPVADMSDEHWAQVMDVNVTTAFVTARAAIPHLRQSSAGRVVLMSSLAAQNGGGNGSVAYSTAKAAVIGFTRALAKELAADRITVNALAPGFIGQTAFHDTFTSPDARAGIVSGIPLGREGTPEDVADVSAFLASDLSSYVTGQVLSVNGGQYFA